MPEEGGGKGVGTRIGMKNEKRLLLTKNLKKELGFDLRGTGRWVNKIKIHFWNS